MKKADLEIANVKLRNTNALLKNALVEIRRIGRDCVGKKADPNPVWLIEKVTEVLAKASL